MCRLVGWVSRRPATLTDVLGEAAVRRFVHLSHVHADGWGAAWHDERGALAVTRSSQAAGVDPHFERFATGLAVTSCFVHLRLGTPGCGYGPLSNHPFVDGPWALAHNGAFAPGDRMDLLLPANTTRRPAGETDTERYFLALREAMDSGGRSVPAAVDTVLARMAEVGLEASSLNALLLGPDALYTISSHDADWQATTIQVWPADEVASGGTPPYFPMIVRRTDDLVAVASSGIVSEPDGWDPVPNDAVLRVDLATRTTTTTPVTAMVSTG